MHNIEIWSQILLEYCGVNAARLKSLSGHFPTCMKGLIFTEKYQSP